MWAVPVFVMISGALFLSRKNDIKKLYKKNILRMCVSFAVWSAFYAISYAIVDFFTKADYQFSFSYFLGELLSGAAHMWFIPMIIGIYMCVPIFEKICESEEIVNAN